MMKNTGYNFSKLSSFKIVLLYTLVSGVYIYTSDNFPEMFVPDVLLLSKLQIYKGLAFIATTSGLLYMLVKRNIDIVSAYYQKAIEMQAKLDRQLLISQQEYMLLFENSPLPRWLFDPETRQFLLVNEAACKTYHFSREEF
jgi:PAS domain-containing protein